MNIAFSESRRPRVDFYPKTSVKASVIVIEQIDPETGAKVSLTFTITESFPVKIGYFPA
jgi:hypothetical protein